MTIVAAAFNGKPRVTRWGTVEQVRYVDDAGMNVLAVRCLEALGVSGSEVEIYALSMNHAVSFQDSSKTLGMQAVSAEESDDIRMKRLLAIEGCLTERKRWEIRCLTKGNSWDDYD